ncbi:hypothetical protein Aab01nite_28690 [Paractinoplanes abujensis]|uniref:Xanthosine utilization system XapX-like protein n=1 Tax=Paractinoplanes abujensis TaxID=882441 RepID=A0A7W7D0T1_9ACTN|nr:hypothetical protein [Actinoplanes abujensis]MBB4698235.1 xanthosine utilization system XapX-like protein [Actinoplanes abujensis]GID19279.1 hypothetical protein Aab01nite_28690 [Actinoplanes abujensis]
MVNEPAPPFKKLHGWLPMALGVLAVVIGALWTLQGFDVLDDSRMSGVGIWSVIGPVVAIGGLILIILGERTRSRAKRAERDLGQ